MTVITTSKIGLQATALLWAAPTDLAKLLPSLGINLISDPPQKSVIGRTPEMGFKTTVDQAGFYF